MNPHHISTMRLVSSKISFSFVAHSTKLPNNAHFLKFGGIRYAYNDSNVRRTAFSQTSKMNSSSLTQRKNIQQMKVKSNKSSAKKSINRSKSDSNKTSTKSTSIRNQSSSAVNQQQQNVAGRSQSFQALLSVLGRRIDKVLLKPRTIPIPRWITPRHYSFTISELCGHGSFLLVAIAYAIDDYFLLRVMAVGGSTSMLLFTYFHPHGRVLWLPFKWNCLFIALNLYRIGKTMYESYMADFLDNDMLKMHNEHLPLVELADFAKLVKIGTVVTYDPGDVITKQGEFSDHISIIMEGVAGVSRDGYETYSLRGGNFISEGGFHAGLQITGSLECSATTTAKNKVRCMQWNRTELLDLCLDDKVLYRSLQFALCWDIVAKLKNQRKSLMYDIQNPELWTRKRKQQTDARYTSILENILIHHGHLNEQKEQLKNYRAMHQISDEQHLKALERCGWTPEEYAIGRKEGVEHDLTEELSGLRHFVARLFR